jgi:hypothetical protein
MGGSVGGFIEDMTGLDMGDHSQADKALAAQREATSSANGLQKYMFDEQRKDQQPWRDAGTRALSGLENKDFQRDFTMNDFQQDPGYAFRMEEGQKAIERSAAARGGRHGGATMKALARYGQDFASNEYQNAYNRFNADRDRRFNRLSSLAGIGQTANSQIANAGMNYANQVGQNQMGMANAQASAAIANGNKMSNLAGQGMTALGMMFSDERLKTDIEPISKEDLKELKETLKAFKFKYKDEAHGAGDWVGVMAQDLEKTKLGKSLVVTDEDGFKQLDLRKVMSLFLATLAEG